MKTVIEMAHEVGFGGTASEFQIKAIERFIDLIRADERDRAMRENAYVQLEREACEEICVANGALGLAAAIRARGDK